MSVFVVEELEADFLADDLRSNVVAFGETEAHLFQNEFNLFLLLHRAIRLHLPPKKKIQTANLKNLNNRNDLFCIRTM